MNVSEIAVLGRIVPFMQSIPLKKKKNIAVPVRLQNLDSELVGLSR